MAGKVNHLIMKRGWMHWMRIAVEKFETYTPKEENIFVKSISQYKSEFTLQMKKSTTNAQGNFNVKPATCTCTIEFGVYW